LENGLVEGCESQSDYPEELKKSLLAEQRERGQPIIREMLLKPKGRKKKDETGE